MSSGESKLSLLTKPLPSGNELEKPIICLEINPPRGTDVSAVFDRLDGQVKHLDFLNITDSALARMKMAALPFAALAKQRYGLEPLVNLACRDRNIIALESDLLAAWSLGVRSIVALTGDAISIGDSPNVKGVFELNSVGLLKLIRTLNSGADVTGTPLKGSTAYICGCVVNPNATNHDAELRRLARKKESGAVYALSQPVFDLTAAVDFFGKAKELGIGILVGLLPVKSRKSLEGLANIPGIKVPQNLIGMFQNVDEHADISAHINEHLLHIARTLRPYVPGFHIVSGLTPKLAISFSKDVANCFAGES